MGTPSRNPINRRHYLERALAVGYAPEKWQNKPADWPVHRATRAANQRNNHQICRATAEAAATTLAFKWLRKDQPLR